MTDAVGFIGLGHMGRPMLGRLLGGDAPVVVTDVDAGAVSRAAEDGATSAASAAEVADRARTVFLSLPTPRIVLSVAAEVAASAAPGALLVDLSTTGARSSRAAAAIARAHGLRFVDAPVSGGVAGAAAGTLAVMASGVQEDLDAVEPFLARFGRVFRVGAEPGMGQLMKLVNNYLSATALAATSEAMVFGARMGLDPQLMLDVVNAGSGRNSATQDKFPRSVLPGTFDFGFSMAMICKDLGLFAEEVRGSGIPLWVGTAVREVFAFALEHGSPGDDFTAVVKPYERWAGVELREPGAS